MEKVIMVSNIISILLILLILAIVSNKQGLKLFKSDKNLKKNLLYRLPIIMFALNILLNIITGSLFSSWIVNSMLILIPFIAYLFKNQLNK